MVTSRGRMQLALALVLVLAMLSPAEGGCRRSSEIECRSGGQCISRNNICNNGRDCSDGSDEDIRLCKLWPPMSDHCRHNPASTFYYAGGCRTAYYLCQNSGQSSDIDSRICKVSWAEARQFCLSIYGDLWHAKDFESYGRLMEYMREAKLTSNYWIGGRYDIATNAWSWTTDDSAMPLGAPFWSMKYESSCVPRGPPHTDPYSAPPAALPGAPCYQAVLSPKQRSPGWCSAMTYEHFYYWSDEMCDEAFSPLCIFIRPAVAHNENESH